VPEALIALGGNIGDARRTIRKAIEIFCDGDDVWLRKRSSDYKTPPWGVTDQPPFINAAISVGTGLEPRALLERAHAVERIFGRNREKEERWGPRSLDIDLIVYNDLIVNEPDLVLPHPRLFERAFVLVPLAEIVPDRLIAGTLVKDAAQRVDKAGIERLST
jgi:2-amino-4-hydroxy-6-hydroxymethyldihydropteridine diphosphokinase